MIKGTKKEFENLADYILHDYFGEDYDTPKPMDIFSFAENYLKMDVGYIEFAKSNHIIGVRSAGRIYVDKELQAPEKRGTRNFTVAHECAHEIINWQDENYNPGQLINCRERRGRKRLVTEKDVKEWQANVVGAYLLMRPSLVGWCLFTFSKKDTLTVFGDRENPAMYFDDAMALKCMADYMGVSKSALRFRLYELGMITERPFSEYDFAMADFSRIRRCV